FAAETTANGVELFRSDGTAAGTALIGEIAPGSNSSGASFLVAAGAQVFAIADDGVHGNELWVTDGFSLRMVTDLSPGRRSGVFRCPMVYDPASGLVVFAGSDGVSGLRLWVTDGTAANTRPLGRFGSNLGSGLSQIAVLALIGSDLWFDADDGV